MVILLAVVMPDEKQAVSFSGKLQFFQCAAGRRRRILISRQQFILAKHPISSHQFRHQMNATNSMQPLVGILMGSDTDWPIMKTAVEVCAQFGIFCEAKVISAHRTPQDLEAFAVNALMRGMKVIIAGAGGAAHLPGVTAAFTILPVIGVPIAGKVLDGMDSLLSIVQMPPGVPVATVGIGAAKNAGILAVQILAVGDERLQKALMEFKQKLADESRAKNQTLTQ
jgi:5-(carboxyamino)imidazole ribonucleotide mutase